MNNYRMPKKILNYRQNVHVPWLLGRPLKRTLDEAETGLWTRDGWWWWWWRRRRLVKILRRIPYRLWVSSLPSCHEEANGNPLSMVPCGTWTARFWISHSGVSGLLEWDVGLLDGWLQTFRRKAMYFIFSNQAVQELECLALEEKR